MKQKKTLQILLLVFAGLIVLYTGVNLYQKQQSSKEDSDQTMISDLKSLTSISYNNNGTTLSFIKQNGSSSQLYRWISLRQQDFLLPWFQSGAAGSGLYTGCVLQDIAGKAAGSIAGVRRDHFFTQPHAQQEPEAG